MPSIENGDKELNGRNSIVGEERSMQNLEEGLRWLDQARADFKTAKDCLKDKNYYASAFFLSSPLKKL
ncbi:MAG: hypothetical protein AOA66_0149 [Candidatus Bathyarchaeota archaeon BA2]|nr:MAG: hypothetical protein AOA66_0149 [Candidatus Bathyarchaeota archaeon BA2]